MHHGIAAGSDDTDNNITNKDNDNKNEIIKNNNNNNNKNWQLQRDVSKITTIRDYYHYSLHILEWVCCKM